MAATSTPRAAPWRQASRAAVRSVRVRSVAALSFGRVIHTIATRGAGATTANVTSVTTPSVPSEPMNRSTRSMPGAAK